MPRKPQGLDSDDRSACCVRWTLLQHPDCEPQPALTVFPLRWNSNAGSRVSYGSRRAMGGGAGVKEPLVYFTHTINAKTYGAWYRRLSSTEIEVFAVGLMKRASCPDGQELATSRAILEEFVGSREQQ